MRRTLDRVTDTLPAARTLEELRAFEPEVVATVRRWLDEAARVPPEPAAQRLAAMLRDDAGLQFTVGFVDRVIRPEDTRVAARNLARLTRSVPKFLPRHLRALLRLGAVFGLVVPWLVIPVVRRALRHMLGHLVVDARRVPLRRAIRRLRAGGASLNLNLLGEAVLGEHEAGRRLAGTRRLVARRDVDYVSIKVSSTVAPHSPWAFDDAVRDIVESLAPLFDQARDTGTFVNLDMEEYRDLDLTVAVFTALLERPALRGMHAGIVLQAYLPDSLDVLVRLEQWAAARVAGGGAPIKVRIVKGANLPMEHVDAAVHGWPLATWSDKAATDTHYKRLLDYALSPGRVANVRIGVAGHNLFDVAFAWLLAQRRDVLDGVDFEMLLGMAPGQAEVVRREVGGLLLYTPVVHPREFDVAISYLVRRLEEGASHDNFMSAVFDLHDDPALFERERARFSLSLAALDRDVPAPKRRARPKPSPQSEFTNTPDTDPAVPASRQWAASILAQVPSSRLGADAADAARVGLTQQLDAVLGKAATSGWGGRGDRAEVLRAVAVELELRRAELVEVMAAECGKTVDQADPEVSEAIDFANYYASLASELAAIDGAAPQPVPLTVVTPPWNFPVAIPAGSTLAALAAGSAVVLKPAPQARRCAAVMVGALYAGGVPADALSLVDVDEDTLGAALIADPRVGRLILTGAYETAQLFRSFRHDLPLLGETSGKNAIVVTPSADLDLAVRDVVASAFGHAGQKCSAASLVILVGSAARSRRFRNQLRDAVTSLTVGAPAQATSRMGPLIGPPSGKLLDALTTLQPGERWLVRPRRLGQATWTPGVKEGVAPGSPFHLTECFGPVLGMMHADSLEQATSWQNAVPYGLTAGIHSLDRAEVAAWIDAVQAGNLYVNKGITGAIVRRQPFGGWKRSSVGAGTKAGGPNYLIGLTDWVSESATHGSTIGPRIGRLLVTGVDTERLRRAFRSDALAWQQEFGTVRDVSQLGLERNVLRYCPVPVLVRCAVGGDPTDLLRVVGAGLAARALLSVSAPSALPGRIAAALGAVGVAVSVEDDDTWRDRLAALDGGRVRLIGGDEVRLFDAIDGRPDVAVYAQPVTEAGRIEMLPFLREQAVSITAHRFGTPDPLAFSVLPETGAVS